MSAVHSTKLATLPANYEEAKDKLAQCLAIDECKEWADKAAALASYAKQSEDETLFQTAMRIKGRAIRRCGELLGAKEFAVAEGRPKQAEKPAQAARVLQTRETIEEQTGLSPQAQTQALRIASIPKRDFEKAIDAEMRVVRRLWCAP